MNRFPQPYFRSQRGTWCVQLDGKQITLGRDKDEAFRRYRCLMVQREQPEVAVSQETVRVVGVLDAYLDWLQKRVEEGTKAQRTYDWYFLYLQDFTRFNTAESSVVSLTIDQLEPIHVYRWVDSHPNWKTGKRGAMTAVQRAFSWAARAGLLKSLGGKSPLATLEKPQQGRREQLVSDQEYRDVLSATCHPQGRDLIELSWETGMRPHELFTCEARFFEPASSRLVFPVKLSKGKKVQRVVYLNDRAMEIVQKCAIKHPSGPLLRNADGVAWTGAAVNSLFQRIRQELGRRRLRQLGIMPAKIRRLTDEQRKDPAMREEHERKVIERRKQISLLARDHGTKYSLYAFRHAYCTEALENGVDAVTVSVLMGHRDTTMISRVYAHVGKQHEHMRKAANQARSSSASA